MSTASTGKSRLVVRRERERIIQIGNSALSARGKD